jgi:hypothetical protein
MTVGRVFLAAAFLDVPSDDKRRGRLPGPGGTQQRTAKIVRPPQPDQLHAQRFMVLPVQLPQAIQGGRGVEVAANEVAPLRVILFSRDETDPFRNGRRNRG